jgi:WD40 repeat protein
MEAIGMNDTNNREPDFAVQLCRSDERKVMSHERTAVRDYPRALWAAILFAAVQVVGPHAITVHADDRSFVTHLKTIKIDIDLFGSVSDIACSGNGRTILAMLPPSGGFTMINLGHIHRRVAIVSTDSGAVLLSPWDEGRLITSASISDDGLSYHLITETAGVRRATPYQLVTRETTTGSITSSLDIQEDMSALNINEVGNATAVYCRRNQVTTVDFKDVKKTTSYNFASTVNQCRVVGRKRLLTVEEDGELTVQNLADPHDARSFKLQSNAFSAVAASDDGRFVVLHAVRGGQLLVRDFESGKDTVLADKFEDSFQVKFVPLTKTLAISEGTSGSCLKFIDVVNGNELARISDKSISSFGFSSSGSYLAIATRAGTVELYWLQYGAFFHE